MSTDKISWRWLVLVFMLTMTACDPCEQLSRKMCACHTTQVEVSACLEGLKLAKAHDAYKTTASPNRDAVCEEAMKNCTCEDFNMGKLGRCAVNR
jgi:hypothetical protein